MMTQSSDATNQTNQTNQTNVSETSSIEVSDRTNSLVDQNLPDAPESVRNETKQLIEAMTRKAQSETQKAGEYAKENYLEAVRNVRTEVEKLNFDPERIEESVKLMQMDAEKNWESLVKEIEGFGNRLNEAAQAAWSILTAPHHSTTGDQSDSSSQS
jgi:predicted negative regulator of RcsB-dependent stress response